MFLAWDVFCVVLDMLFWQSWFLYDIYDYEREVNEGRGSRERAEWRAIRTGMVLEGCSGVFSTLFSFPICACTRFSILYEQDLLW